MKSFRPLQRGAVPRALMEYYPWSRTGALYSRSNIAVVPIQVIRTVTQRNCNVNTEIPLRGYYSTPKLKKKKKTCIIIVTVYYVFTPAQTFCKGTETPFTLDEVTTARLWGHSPLLQQSDKTILHTRHEPQAVCLLRYLQIMYIKIPRLSNQPSSIDLSSASCVSVVLCYDHYTLRFTFPHTQTDASLSKWHDNLQFQVNWLHNITQQLLASAQWYLESGGIMQTPPILEWTTGSLNRFGFKYSLLDIRVLRNRRTSMKERGCIVLDLQSY